MPSTGNSHAGGAATEDEAASNRWNDFPPFFQPLERLLWALALHARVALPDAPDLIFVGGLPVIGKKGGRQRAGRPAELRPFLWIPAAQDGVEHTADKAVAAADPIQDADVARFNDMPVSAFRQNGAPAVRAHPGRCRRD